VSDIITPPAAEGPLRLDSVLRIGLPIVVLGLAVLAWDLVVRINGIPPYILRARCR